jgi:hypothetical protein
MLNSTFSKAAPQFFSSGHTFLQSVVAQNFVQKSKFSTVAFNLKSRFEEAYEKKTKASGGQKKQ